MASRKVKLPLKRTSKGNSWIVTTKSEGTQALMLRIWESMWRRGGRSIYTMATTHQVHTTCSEKNQKPKEKKPRSVPHGGRRQAARSRLPQESRCGDFTECHRSGEPGPPPPPPPPPTSSSGQISRTPAAALGSGHRLFFFFCLCQISSRD